MKANRQPQRLKIKNRKQYTKAKDFDQTVKVLFIPICIYESRGLTIPGKNAKISARKRQRRILPMASEQTVVLHSRDEMCRKYKRRRIICAA